MQSAQSHTGGHPALFRSALILAVQLLPCLGLMLFGWGFDSLPAFFASAPRAGLVAITLIAAIIAAYCKIDFNPFRKGVVAVGNQNWQLAVLLSLALALLWFLPFAEGEEILNLRADFWPYLGLLLFSIGGFVRIAALKTLAHTLLCNPIIGWCRKESTLQFDIRFI